jgi:hypothetical protein
MRGIAVLVILSACLLAGCGSSGKSSGPATRPQDPALHTLKAGFAVFRRPQSAADIPPPQLLPREIARSLHLDLSTARLARRYHGSAIYVVLSPTLACTYSTYHPVGNCWPIATTRGGLAFASSICGLGTRSDEIVLYGLVPDAVRRVMVPGGSGRDRTVAVVDNLFVASSSSRPPLPQHLLLLTERGRLRRPTGIPAGVARRGCTPGPSVPAG